jgi:6-phosphogluconolactonase
VAIVTVLRDQETLATAAAERVMALAAAAIAARQRASLCLSGGQTPRRLYELLADPSRPWRATVDWTRVHVFWGDERPVPPDHPESNFGMAYRALLANVPIPADQIHRMRGELVDAAEAAREYEMVLSGAGLDRSPRGPQGSAPQAMFDVLLLGLGEDAHIASVFPGSPLFHVGADRLRAASASRLEGSRVAAVWVNQLNAWRITLTPPALLAARAILVLVSGAGKADAVRAALEGPEDLSRWPVQLLRAAGTRVEWLIDSAAAQRLGAPPA